MLSRLVVIVAVTAAMVISDRTAAFGDEVEGGLASFVYDETSKGPGYTAIAKWRQKVRSRLARHGNDRPSSSGVAVRRGEPSTTPCQAEAQSTAVWDVPESCLHLLSREGPAGRDRVPPVAVAVAARARLVLPAPKAGSSPGPEYPQLVRLPVWLWVDRASWRPYTATATAGPVTATVSATPTTLSWDMGDGSAAVVCRGPGTRYRPGGDPGRPSPTCGYTYQRASIGVPGEAYRVTATISWAITWSGAGQSGTLPSLTTSALTSMRVAESQAIVTGSGTR